MVKDNKIELDLDNYNNIKGFKKIFYPKDFAKLDIAPRERTDMVEVDWK